MRPQAERCRRTPAAPLLHPEWSLLDHGQLEQGRRADDLLGAVDVGHARQLDQDLVRRTVAGDDRLGDAELVTRRSIVWSAWLTVLSRLFAAMFGFIVKL
jgi:hypothetical protein